VRISHRKLVRLHVAVAAVTPVAATVETVEVDLPAPDLSFTLAAVMPPTIEALEDAEGAATGHNGRYEVTWSDAFYFGSQGYGVVETTAIVHLATGIFVDRLIAPPGTTL
jgi:hypothetical protein